MRTVGLITGNFLREQRWVLLALAIYAGGLGAILAFAGDRPERSDLIFYAQQQGMLGLLFGVFLISSAIHNDRRSHRVLVVISKSVSRWQYLAALALGAGFVSAGFITLAFGGLLVASSRWLMPADAAFRILLVFFPLAALAICIGLCLSTVVHPFFANTLTLIVLGGSFAGASYLGGSAVLLLPGANLLLVGLKGRSGAELSVGGIAVLLQAAAVFALACWLFSRRDLGANVE